MSDRVEYIRRRLDELEAAAKAAMMAAPPPWILRYDQHGDDRWLDIDATDGTSVIETESGANGPPIEVAEHIALNDPAAVLARVAADRAKLARLVDVEPCTDSGDSTAGDLADDMIRLLAEGLGYKEATSSE